MTTQKEFQFKNPFVVLISFVLILVALFWVAKGIFRLISFAAPFFLVAALIINYKVVLGYGRWLINLLRTNVLFGIGGIVFSLVAFPLVSVFLLVKAIASRSIEKAVQKAEGEYIEYEEVAPGDFLSLDDIKTTSEKINNNYKDVFE